MSHTKQKLNALDRIERSLKNMANLTPSGGLKATACMHTTRTIRVLSAIVGCETTAEFCACCGKQLTKPNTDCR